MCVGQENGAAATDATKYKIKEREILVAVVVVAGNVEFKPMCCKGCG
jgi:hypothetical protein